MLRKLFNILLLTPFLMAFQCDKDEPDNTYIFNKFEVSVTPQASFSINDTIWINGKISSKVFDTSVNDSIFLDRIQEDNFSVMKFIQPTQSFNCKDAIDKFELITELGNLSFYSECENGDMWVQPELSSNGSFYTYRIGLKAVNTGDFVLSWNESSLTNANRNQYILNDYPLELHPNQIGFNKCGNVFWKHASESDKEFYFRVE